MLAHPVSRLININPNIHLDPDPEGLEYGYCIFEYLSNASTTKVLSKGGPDINERNAVPTKPTMGLNIMPDKLNQLQQYDPFCMKTWKELQYFTIFYLRQHVYDICY